MVGRRAEPPALLSPLSHNFIRNEPTYLRLQSVTPNMPIFGTMYKIFGIWDKNILHPPWLLRRIGVGDNQIVLIITSLSLSGQS